MDFLLKNPDWRFTLAEEYANKHGNNFKKIKFPSKEDKTVIKLTEYLCKALPGRIMSRELSLDFPYIHAAYTLHRGRDSSFGEVWTLEALVMAGLTDDQVAQYLSVDAAFVKIFCLCLILIDSLRIIIFRIVIDSFNFLFNVFYYRITYNFSAE